MLIINLTGRNLDLKAPSITAYYHKLSSNIPDDMENKVSLVESYMKYVDYFGEGARERVAQVEA